MGIMSKFPSKYLNGDDISAGEIATVKMVRDELVGTDQDCKPVLYLEEHARGIVLNKTNAGNLVRVFGDDEKKWPGKKILLATELTRNPSTGTQTNAIRLQAAAVAKKPAASVAEEIDDTVPF
jgi:hypothetical protein